MWLQVRREYLAQTCLFCLENLLMLWPLLNTCLTVIHVYSTIPILPEEEGCLVTCYILLSSPVLVIGLAVLQHFLFMKYNTSGHTWKKLLNSRRVFHVAVCMVGSSLWKTEEANKQLRLVWKDLKDPKDGRRKVKAIRVERLADWGQSEDDEKNLWKAVITVSPELDFHTFESMARSSKYFVKELVREELRSGPEEKEEEINTSCCLCSCIPKVELRSIYQNAIIRIMTSNFSFAL